MLPPIDRGGAPETVGGHTELPIAFNVRAGRMAEMTLPPPAPPPAALVVPWYPAPPAPNRGEQVPTALNNVSPQRFMDVFS